MLTPAQLRLLRRLTASRDTPQYIVARAGHVLAEHEVRTGGLQAASSSSRQTTAKWFVRFIEQGAAGLQDAPRSGRPSTLADDVRRTVTAPLFLDSPHWTTRTVAGHTGTSQSAVARVWRRVYRDAPWTLGDSIPASGLLLEAARSGSDGSMLVLRAGHPHAPRPPVDFMRSPLRPALQVVLATQVLATPATGSGRPARRDPAPADPDLRDFLSRIRVSAPEELSILCSSAATASVVRRQLPRTSVVEIPPPHWQGVLVDLGTRLATQGHGALLDAQQHAREWARRVLGPWTWEHAGRRPEREQPGPPALHAEAPGVSVEKITRAVLECLHEDLMAGRLGAGDRLTETYLARRTLSSRGPVRDALKVLASRGILLLEPHRGAVVPSPSVDDVVEIYAARRSLGALLVRRAAEAPVAGHLDLLDDALAAMLETAAGGDALATGELDLQLQEIVAAMAGTRRIAALYGDLTDQLRVLVAALRIRYAYSIPAMCDDNTLLVDHIRERRAGEAVATWSSKMNDAANYMISQIEPQASLRTTPRSLRP